MRHSRRGLLLGLVGNHRLGGHQQARHGCGVLQREPDDLGRVDDTGLDHVDILARLGVEAEIRVLAVEQFADDDRSLVAGVFGDLADRGLQRAADDVDTDFLVAIFRRQSVERLGRIEQRDAAAGYDTLLDRGAGGVGGVVDPVLALLDLDLGRHRRPGLPRRRRRA